MTTNFEQVQAFIGKINELRDNAGLGIVDIRTQFTLVQEEHKELSEAFTEWQEASNHELYHTQLNVQKEALDLLYVVYGLLALIGGDVDKGFKTVHENNMTKFAGGAKFREDGKLLKNEQYVKLTPEDLARGLWS